MPAAKHYIGLGVLLSAATALYVTAQQLPPEWEWVVYSSQPDTPVADSSAPPVAIATTAPIATPLPKETLAPVAVATTAPKPSAKPTAVPAAQATPKPSAKPSEKAPDGRIPATDPDRILGLAKASAGRYDPFVAVLPPAEAALTIPKPPKTIGGQVVAVDIDPFAGVTVTGIIGGPQGAMAILLVEGQSHLVQVGEVIPGGYRVMKIEVAAKAVTLGQGQRVARLVVKE